jgi:hypothetical protein
MLGTSQAVNSAPPREAARRRAHYAPLMSKIAALVADFRWVAEHKPAATPNVEPCPEAAERAKAKHDIRQSSKVIRRTRDGE